MDFSFGLWLSEEKVFFFVRPPLPGLGEAGLSKGNGHVLAILTGILHDFWRKNFKKKRASFLDVLRWRWYMNATDRGVDGSEP